MNFYLAANLFVVILGGVILLVSIMSDDDKGGGCLSFIAGMFLILVGIGNLVP